MNSKLGDTEECIQKNVFRIEISSTTQQEKEKQIKKNENWLRDFGDNIKHTNIHIIGVPEREEIDKEVKMHLIKL